MYNYLTTTDWCFWTPVKFSELLTQEEIEFLGVGLPDPKKTKLPTDEELLIQRIKIKTSSKTHYIPVSLNWDVKYFNIPNKLKSFLKSEKINTLKDFIDSYKKLLSKVPHKFSYAMEGFHLEVRRIIDNDHPMVALEIIRKVKISRNVDYKTIILQQSFAYSLYFFDKLFKKCREFKKCVFEIARELKLKTLPVYNWRA